MNFIGVKAALLLDDKLVIIQRDDIPSLKFAGLWDLPGGGREDDETPFECLAREVKEELNLDLSEKSIIWHRTYPSVQNPKLKAHFMVIRLSGDDIANIQLGDEGQAWKLITLEEFLQDQEVIEGLKNRIKDYLSHTSA